MAETATSAGAPVTSAPPDTADQHILNSATLLMALTGAGKSALLATLMEWAFQTFGAISFLYLFDGGGFPTQVQALINRGICRLWRVRTRSGEGLAPETIQRAAMGWWPSKIDPRTGTTAPTVRLVAPVTTIYTMSCPNGHLVRSSAAQAALTPGPCPTCKNMVDRTNMRITTAVERTKGFPEKRLALYDGISAACSWLLDDLSHRTLGGEQSRLGGTVMSGEMIFGENNRAQVGFTQNSAERWVLASSAIPDLVVPPVWTALTKEGSDEASLTVVGPDLAGQAKIAVAGQWFGNTLEALVVERGGKRYRQIRTAQWIDEKQRRHLCRVGSYPGAIPPIFEEEEHEDGAGAFTEFNLGLFHQRLADARRATEALYAERYQTAPGMAEGEQTYGDTGGGTQNVTAAPVPPAQGRVAVPPPPPQGRATTPSHQPQGAGPVAGVTPGTAVAGSGPVPPAGPAGPSPAPTKPSMPPPGRPPAPQPAPPARPVVSAATGLPPARIGPPKPPQAGPATPAGRKPQSST